MSERCKTDLEAEVYNLSCGDLLIDYFKTNGFFQIYNFLINFDPENKTNTDSICVNLMLSKNILMNSMMMTRTRNSQEYENIVRKFSLLCFYCYFRQIGVEHKLFEQFKGYEQIFNSFFEQNSNELEKNNCGCNLYEII
jgi:hypothetical protein